MSQCRFSFALHFLTACLSKRIDRPAKGRLRGRWNTRFPEPAPRVPAKPVKSACCEEDAMQGEQKSLGLQSTQMRSRMRAYNVHSFYKWDSDHILMNIISRAAVSSDWSPSSCSRVNISLLLTSTFPSCLCIYTYEPAPHSELG